jgi:hypothetical protein
MRNHLFLTRICDSWSYVNMGNQMVGHLKREVAAKLSPLIDSSLIAEDGVMDEGNMNSGSSWYTLPMCVLAMNNPRTMELDFASLAP